MTRQRFGTTVPRRAFLGTGLIGLGSLAAAILGTATEERMSARTGRRLTATPPSAQGRLTARRAAPVADAPVGLQPLGLARDRDGLVYVPATYRPDRALPLVLMLHGAGGNARHGLDPFQVRADEAELILLAPDSRGSTWDVLRGGFGPDVQFIDLALRQTFDLYAVDPARVVVEGFSDGASYALSLGLTNGDLFSHVVAFSPGFAAPGTPSGSPLVYVSHGTDDDVLPIDVCSRRIVPALERAGYAVTYHEFEGGHWVPPDIADEAIAWMLETSPQAAGAQATPNGGSVEAPQPA